MQLAVLVNGPVNAREKAVCLEPAQMFLEIERGPGEFFSMWPFRLAGSIEHARPPRKLLETSDYGSVSGEAKSIRCCACSRERLKQLAWRSKREAATWPERNRNCGFAGVFPKSLTQRKAVLSQMAGKGLMQYKVI